MNLIARVLSPEKALIEDQRVAAKIVSDVLRQLESLTKPDVDLAMLDEIAERMIREAGATPYNKGYHPEWSKEPFPSTICVSVNEEVCHGLPRGILKDGDIVTYDIGVKFRRGCGDAALTVAVGNISNRKERTMRYAKRALYEGIKVVKAGVVISEIGEAIGSFCMQNGFEVIKEYGGHHIGEEMHEEPHIPHFKNNDSGEVLNEGSIICIEPIITPGKDRLGLAADQWTSFTLDGQATAMFEHMVLVTKDGYEILTDHI